MYLSAYETYQLRNVLIKAQKRDLIIKFPEGDITFLNSNTKDFLDIETLDYTENSDSEPPIEYEPVALPEEELPVIEIEPSAKALVKGASTGTSTSASKK